VAVSPGGAPVAAPGTAEPRVERYAPQSLTGLKAAANDRRDWLWQGYLAPGNVTLLTSLWKSGKSTLISVLLSRLKTGGTLAGLPLRPGRALVVSEESPQLWLDRSQVVDLDGHVEWICQPFRGNPTEKEWLELLDRIAHLHDQSRIDLLVIDALANLAPMRSENDSVQMLNTLRSLQPLTARGICPLIAHHPKKGPTVPGQAARGSGALSGSVDIIIEMQPISRQPGDRRRLLRAYSRHPATLPSLVIEWTADGTDYLSLGTSIELNYEYGWPVLREVLEQAERPLTRREILQRWPETALAPAKLTLWKWLGRAVQEGRVLQEGRGNRKEPFLYLLPGMVEKWQQDFVASFMKRLEDNEPKPPGHLP
jgi:hypothetical protein